MARRLRTLSTEEFDVLPQAEVAYLVARLRDDGTPAEEKGEIRDALVLSVVHIAVAEALKIDMSMPREFDRDDLIGEAVLAATLALDDYDPNVAAWSTYAARRVRWGLLDFMRGFRHPMDSLDESGVVEPYCSYTDQNDPLLADALICYLSKLPAREHEVIVDRYFNHSTLARIGKARGLSPATILTIQANAEEKIRRMAVRDLGLRRVSGPKNLREQEAINCAMQTT